MSKDVIFAKEKPATTPVNVARDVTTGAYRQSEPFILDLTQYHRLSPFEKIQKEDEYFMGGKWIKTDLVGHNAGKIFIYRRKIGKRNG
jgi:hypothetical protein